MLTEAFGALCRRTASPEFDRIPGEISVRLTIANKEDFAPSWGRRVARGDDGPTYGTGTSLDARTSRSNLDPSGPRAPRGPRSVGFCGSFHQAGWPANAPVFGRASDGGGGVFARIERRGDCAYFDSSRVPDNGRVYEAIQASPRYVTWTVSSRSESRWSSKSTKHSGRRSRRITSDDPKSASRELDRRVGSAGSEDPPSLSAPGGHLGIRN